MIICMRGKIHENTETSEERFVKKDFLGGETMNQKITNDEIIFVGAGPGDPELITVKGSRALERADRVIYAGSLVNPELLRLCRLGTPVHDSAPLTLEEDKS